MLKPPPALGTIVRFRAAILLVLLLAPTAVAARNTWNGAGRGVIQWASVECPATFEVALDRVGDSGNTWSIDVTVIQDAAVVKLSSLCLPGVGRFSFPAATGTDRVGWTQTIQDACGYRSLRISFPIAPPLNGNLPGRVAEIEYVGIGPCVPYGMPRATGGLAMATTEPI